MESHELYCAGHLIEAAVAYAEATGDLRLIAVSDRFIACIKKAFGPNEGQINGADGHQEIELALVRLYEFTGNKNYLDLSYVLSLMPNVIQSVSDVLLMFLD